jgi:glutamate racemase
VILACNTSSAKALRTIQQKDLIQKDSHKRVLGVIRPTSEIVGHYTKSKHIGIFATSGTVLSESYVIEIQKFFPELNVYQEACPMWVPLIENHEINNIGADYFVQKHIDRLFLNSKQIDTIILGCTHYPLLMPVLLKYLPKEVTILTQGEIVANSLKDYLVRHEEMNNLISKNKQLHFLTTDDTRQFDEKASVFFGSLIQSSHISL